MLPTFDAIFGQDRPIAALRAAYESQHLPHGLIFAGPSGVGKATAAAALACLFLCENPKKFHPCGKCPSCRAFDGGVHPDYHIITKELVRIYDKTGKSKAVSMSIEVIRQELLIPAGRKTALGQGKVFVVEQAESMTPAAQNAMLKTLEEPAGRALIVLLSDQPESLLPTVRSRCQTIRFSTIDPNVVRRELEKRGLDRANAAELSDGSIGTALRWIEDGVIAPAAELAARMDAYLSGRDIGDLAEWLKSAADAYAEKQIERDELTSKDAAARSGLVMYLALAARRLRKRMAESSEISLLDRACAAIEVMNQAEIYLEANVNIPVILQQIAVALAMRESYAARL